ncbi:hypothetical protein [Faecalispora jeddahensis]|uniref:hypothetical protein n=1 Tax=Faecalispora jeddahensis TaxID=1414721 RepID=UPI00189AB7F9|nr:hypothetical protein [Faecalispora jeddahensis]
MLTREPTKELLQEYKSIWMQYKGRLRPNRKSGRELLDYLQQKYILTEIWDKEAADAVILSVTQNQPYKEKLPMDMAPVPRTFFLENTGNGEVFYTSENKDPIDIWGGDITRIFIGIDLTTGYFTAEGSTMLWDEMYAFRGLDEEDLKNYVRVAQYILALKRFGLLQQTVF